MAGINENLDKERRDLLNQDPLPTLEMAYAMIRREIARRGIMGTTSSLGTSPSEIGKGLAIKNRPEPSFRRDNGDRIHLKCTHCGGTKHTKEGCFKLIGYPEWWEEHKHRRSATKAIVTRIGDKTHLAFDFSGNLQTPQEPTVDLHSLTGKTSSKVEHTNSNGGKEESRNDSNNSEKQEEREKAGSGEREGGWVIPKNSPFYREIKYPNPTQIPRCPHNSTHQIHTPIPPLNSHKGLICEKKTSTWIFDCGATDTMT